MSSLVAPILSLLLLYKYWGLFCIQFVAALLLPIPMNAILLATGAFASQGYFNLFFSLGTVVAANVAGDCFGYFLAHKYGRRIFHILHIRQPATLAKIENYARQRPRATIFFSRFIGALGSLTNLFAGFSGIPFRTFLGFDFLGNVASGAVVMCTGYFLGVYWQDFLDFFDIGGWVIAVLAALVFFVFWYRKNHAVKFENQ